MNTEDYNKRFLEIITAGYRCSISSIDGVAYLVCANGDKLKLQTL